MKTKLEILAVLILLLTTACGCVKDIEEQLPPITQTGENTFGCLIDGKVFETSKEKKAPTDGYGTIGTLSSDTRGVFSFVGRDFSSTKGDDYFVIEATDFKDPNTDIYIYIL